ncbi:TPA: P2 family phage major capsid protein [Escherichia coli]|nr:hypothetical protein [Escherichia coli O8]
MKKNTRFAFNAYLQQLARLNGVAVEELSSKFTVEPSVQQTLEDQIQQSAAFLTLINVTPVTEQSGQAIMDMDVNAMMTVIPRISSPALTAQEIAEMDPADLTAMSVEVVTFLLKKSVLAGLPTA